MYFRILKKDLQRKKTMNIILLIFVILASTFIASSVNNLIVITTALDDYFKKAGLSDFMMVTIKDDRNDKLLEEFLEHNKYVSSWNKDNTIYITKNDLRIGDNKEFTLEGTALINSSHIQQQKFFDENNKLITGVKDGSIYLQRKDIKRNKLKAGDIITINNGGVQMKFTIQGSCKDAFLGSEMMGASRFVVSDNDLKKLETGKDIKTGYLYSLKSVDIKAMEKDFNRLGANVIVGCDKSLISVTYSMDMIIAGILLAVSVCLILISFVILRFTIVFTLNEEFREIGIMKAIGIKSRRVRGLYIVKYLAVSIVGAFIGFVISIPFAAMFLAQASRNIIIESNAGIYVINFVCSMSIVAVVILFCYFCTRQVNRFSPIDAIRIGANGERFKKKGILSLSRHRLPAVLFLALNDILSGLKKYSVLIITFTLATILVILPINTINTLKSENLISLFGMVRSNVYLSNVKDMADFRKGGHEYVKSYLKDMEAELKKNGIPANVYCETLFKFKISYKSSSYISIAEQGTGVDIKSYVYTRGKPPEYANEVALTKITADKVGATLGDTVKVKTGEKEQEYIVTAMFESMNNLGEGIRFTEDAPIDYSLNIGTPGIQVKYTDAPSTAQIKSRMEKIKKLFPEYEVYNGKAFLVKTIGNIGGQLDGMKRMILVVILFINLLVAVLMEKSFLTKEKGEIGMLKSLGFSNAAIVRWQTERIGFILFLSTVLGMLLSNPAARLTTAKGFQMMGAGHIDFVIKPLEVYLMYPAIIFAVTMTASVLTALQIRGISTRDTNNIE